MKSKFVAAIVALTVASPAMAADLEKGKQAYAGRCSSCHGATGVADGPVAQAMGPGTVTNLVKGPFKFATDADKIEELVVKGGAALGLNPMMPPAPSIDQAELDALSAYVISLRGDAK